MTLILASASPRRRSLLAAAGFAFEIEPADVDESLPSGIDPVAGAEQLACAKAAAVFARHPGESAWILAADTVVARDAGSGPRLLGKPCDAAEAARFLGALSGTRHQVVTGVCVRRCTDGQQWVGSERTWVTMRAIEEREVARYVASGEWRGKAGGYAIQESADLFVTALEEGGFDNVVGLPVELSRALLARAGFPA